MQAESRKETPSRPDEFTALLGASSRSDLDAGLTAISNGKSASVELLKVLSPLGRKTRYALKCPTDRVAKMELKAVSGNTPSRIINCGRPLYVLRLSHVIVGEFIALYGGDANRNPLPSSTHHTIIGPSSCRGPRIRTEALAPFLFSSEASVSRCATQSLVLESSNPHHLLREVSTAGQRKANGSGTDGCINSIGVHRTCMIH